MLNEKPRAINRMKILILNNLKAFQTRKPAPDNSLLSERWNSCASTFERRRETSARLARLGGDRVVHSGLHCLLWASDRLDGLLLVGQPLLLLRHGGAVHRGIHGVAPRQRASKGGARSRLRARRVGD